MLHHLREAIRVPDKGSTARPAKLKPEERRILVEATIKQAGILDHLARFCGGALVGSAIATVYSLVNAASPPEEAVVSSVLRHQPLMTILFRVAIRSSAGPKVTTMANVCARQLFGLNPASRHASHPGQVGISFGLLEGGEGRGEEQLRFDHKTNTLFVSQDLLVPAQLAFGGPPPGGQ